MSVCVHFQHVCLLQESLFQIFQAIKWLREQISPVIRHDLEQKEKHMTQTVSFLIGDECLLASYAELELT